MDLPELKRIFDDTDYVHRSGTPGERQAAEYLLGRCEALGVKAWLEAFPVPMGEIEEAEVLADGKSIPCVFYELTGLYCPGCGSGRAVCALLHGRLREAVGYNVLLFILGPPAVVILLREYARLVFPGLKLRPVSLPQPVILACTAAVLLFWLLRNLPGFSALAPG